jgi:hypothetical protein
LVGAAMAWLPALGITGIVGYGLIRTVFTNPLQGLTKWLLSMGVVSVAGSGVAFVVEAATPGLLGLGLAGGAGGATIVVLMVGVDRLFDLDLAGVLRLVSPRLASFVGRRSQPSAA